MWDDWLHERLVKLDRRNFGREGCKVSYHDVVGTNNAGNSLSAVSALENAINLLHLIQFLTHALHLH